MINIKDIWRKSMYIFNRRQKRRLIFLLIILIGETVLELRKSSIMSTAQ